MPAANVKSRWVSGNLVFYDADGVVVGHVGKGNVPVTLRTRKTIAAVNAGVELLPAIPGMKWRMIDAAMIAVGGAVTPVTTIDILATQATSSVKLVAGAQASMTQSAVLHAGASGAAVLADGASFAANDANTAITANITGSAATVVTDIDFILTFALDAA